MAASRSTRPGRLPGMTALAALAALAFATPAAADSARGSDDGPSAPAGDATTSALAVGRYFDELERLGLLDTRSGSRDTLTRELAAAEALLRGGAAMDAAVALAAIVDSPRYGFFRDFVEYQNAEYDLGVALHTAGAHGAALAALERVLRRGPDATYWGPAHRRAVDVGLDTRDFAGVLARLEAADRAAGLATGAATPIPPSAAGERAYLRGRAAYAAGDLVAAEGDLATVSRKSRLYSSALYLRGVIRARKGQWRDAAAAMCEIAATPDDDTFTFVVDQRYFTIKDLARLGLGRLAHERGEYDDAYYHYFQVPSDSQHLPDALFEASWSMYQKRELATARDLLVELGRSFPDHPQWPEAGLLAGYVELADCKFDDARRHYEALITELGPVVAELDRLRKDPDARGELFRRAVERWTAQAGVVPPPARDATDRVLGLLRLDPAFLRLHEATSGMQRAAGEAPGVVAAWTALAARVGGDRVGAVTADATVEEDEATDAAALHGDLRRLAAEVDRARDELARGQRAGSIPADVAADEARRLDDLAARVGAAAERARDAAREADLAITSTAPAGLAPLFADDLARARRLDRAAHALRDRLAGEAERRSLAMLEQLHRDTKQVLDKARLGRVDSVIGQKRALDIQVQDLAAGRFPPELHGRLWEAGLIGDDEEYWPEEGEYWADEYEGWR